jgi:hypothetical protein
MPCSDLGGQVSDEASQVYHHFWIRDKHSVDCSHVLQIGFEATVVVGKALATEQALARRVILFALVICGLFTAAAAAAPPTSIAGKCIAIVNFRFDLFVEYAKRDRRQ